MSDHFAEGESVLLRGERGSFVVRLIGERIALGPSKGSISASEVIGRRSGDIISIGSREFILLRPDIIDCLEHLDRGPQMISAKDSGPIALYLGIRSGDTVLEAGAGSGGLTMVLLNTVFPHGKVITYDLREEHLKRTRANVEMTGTLQCWEGRIGDIRDHVPDREMDAVALDIPDPENALGSVVEALKPGGRICCYVPTANQVERCFLGMVRVGLTETRALEILSRDLSVKEGATRPSTEMLGHTGYLVLARRSP